MSNPLSIRRVMVQTINEKGEFEDEPTYGVVVSDNETTLFTDSFFSLDGLNEAVKDAGSLIDIVDDGSFSEVDRSIVGSDNFYGKGWR